jgi:hypothetical protein
MTAIYLFLLITKNQQLDATTFNKWAITSLPLALISIFIDWASLIFSMYSIFK